MKFFSPIIQILKLCDVGKGRKLITLYETKKMFAYVKVKEDYLALSREQGVLGFT